VNSNAFEQINSSLARAISDDQNGDYKKSFLQIQEAF